MKIHHFNSITRVYMGSADAEPDQMQPGEYLLPAFSTTKSPPTVPTGFVAVFDADKGDWIVIEQSVAGGVDPSQTLAQRVALLRRAVQAMADSAALSMGFDDMAEAVTYADEPSVAEYQRRGAALRAWRSQLWLAFEPIEAGYLAETLDLPNSQAEALASLPPFSYAPAAAQQG